MGRFLHNNISSGLRTAFLVILLGIFPIQCKKFEVTRVVLLTTDMVAEVAQTKCLATGTLLDLNDQVYPGYGFHWATSMDAILPGDTVNLGQVANTKQFSFIINNLLPGTRYFIWTYVYDGSGEVRADPVEFSTLPAQIPAVETGEVSVTGPTSAQCTYDIVWSGESPVVSRGLCWGETELPTVEGTHSEEGTGTGAYTGEMTALTPATTYRVRAYAVNGVGIAYGVARIFTTTQSGSIPTVVTNPPGEVGTNKAVLGGSISSDGGLPITEKGICLGPDPNPTIEGTTWPMGSGADPFEDVVGDLSPDSRYFCRAYAINNAGVGYGEQFEILTRTQDLVDERDGSVYPTVRIGEQVWMAQNLDIGNMINGSLKASDDGTIQKYCYQNNPAYCELYGALYPWEEMMQYNFTEGAQGVCPEGWHIPKDAEWKELEQTLGLGSTYLDSTGWRGTNQGGKLKVPGTELWDEPNLEATNESGFSALPAGEVNNIGVFDGQGFFTDFWTSTREGDNPWYRYLDAENAGILRTIGTKDYGTSVRCVRD